MISPITHRYQNKLKGTRTVTAAGVRRAWRSLPAYNEEQVKEFFTKITPIVQAGQQKAIAQTSAYLSAKTRSPIVGLDTKKVIKGANNTMTPQEVYRTPFTVVWGALSDGADYQDAVDQGEDSAASMSETDVALAAGAACFAWAEASQEYIVAFMRVADNGACSFCQQVDGAHVANEGALPLHRNCGCTLDPIMGTYGGQGR